MAGEREINKEFERERERERERARQRDFCVGCVKAFLFGIKKDSKKGLLPNPGKKGSTIDKSHRLIINCAIQRL